jgi:hypothetical protein
LNQGKKRLASWSQSIGVACPVEMIATWDYLKKTGMLGSSTKQSCSIIIIYYSLGENVNIQI